MAASSPETSRGLLLRARDAAVQVARDLSWLPPLLARLVLGAVFIRTGWGKLHDLTYVTRYFVSLGIGHAHAMATLVACTELVCGVLVLIGLLTHLAPLPLAAVMAVALATAVVPPMHVHDFGGFVDVLAKRETLFLLVALWLAVHGAGPISADGALDAALTHDRDHLPPVETGMPA